MSEVASVIVAVTALVQLIVSPVVALLVLDAKRLRKKVDKLSAERDADREKYLEAREEDRRKRDRINQLVSRLVFYIKGFVGNAFEILETSRDMRLPITDHQIQRLRMIGDIDDILKEHVRPEGEQ